MTNREDNGTNMFHSINLRQANDGVWARKELFLISIYEAKNANELNPVQVCSTVKADKTSAGGKGWVNGQSCARPGPKRVNSGLNVCTGWPAIGRGCLHYRFSQFSCHHGRMRQIRPAGPVRSGPTGQTVQVNS
ncbi:unnamed protein product [Protopolystoma xenopodis]|uniref:Uncharacterized protein n=1 Tax=Protopolystoma xenopodis TaxID=117903 RepID=A0A448WJF0_9PLAT|nr:unnamed protein product [Protopolystoma xenopodis]